MTYNQMWNLSMRDSFPKNQGSYHRGNQFQFHHGNNKQHGHGNGNNGNSGNGSGQRRKSDYCWNFNKGVPCKFGKKCRFIERCKYCDSANHGFNTCPKYEQKRNSEGRAGTSNSSDSAK